MSGLLAPLKPRLGCGKRYIPGIVYLELAGVSLTNAPLECGVDVHVLV